MAPGRTHAGEPVISSPHNPRVKWLRKLHQRRARHAFGLALAEGWRVIDGLKRAEARFHSLWLAEDARPPEGYEDLLPALAHVPRTTVTAAVMKTIADTTTPQGVAAVVEIPRPSLSDVLGKGEGLVLVLDGIQDPGNGGALVRTAVAAGVQGIITTSGTVDLYSPKALRGAAGLTVARPVAADVPVPEVMAALKERGITVRLLDVGPGTSPFDLDWRGGHALVVGSEARGAHPLFREAAETVRIPMAPPAESLNVAVSAAVCLYEAARQRGSFLSPGR